MNTGNNAELYDWANEEVLTENIIYLNDHRKTRGPRKDGKGDIFWNIVFIALCICVPLVLFLH